MITITSFKQGPTLFQSQRGDALIEAMIGGLLMVILFVGTMLAVGKIMTNQRTMNTHDIAVLEMHETLQTIGIEDMCGGTGAGTDTIAGQTITYGTTCNTATVTMTLNALSETVSVAGTGFTLNTVDDTTSRDLLGGDGIVNAGY
jgi:hypothetical protein